MPKLETARIMIFNRHHDTFVVERKFGSNQRSGQLDFLGGRIDRGETALQGALREVKEEGYIDLGQACVEHVLTWPDRDGELDIRRHYYMANVEDFPKKVSEELIGSAVLQATIAYDNFGVFLPSQVALGLALNRLPVA
jgi:8-oxo-dGTP pyrophosphatase MutT (NUDIX family)